MEDTAAAPAVHGPRSLTPSILHSLRLSAPPYVHVRAGERPSPALISPLSDPYLPLISPALPSPFLPPPPSPIAFSACIQFTWGVSGRHELSTSCVKTLRSLMGSIPWCGMKCGHYV